MDSDIITGGKNISEILGDDIKIEAELNCPKGNNLYDYFIIYGLKSKSEINDVINKLSNISSVNIIRNPIEIEDRCGLVFDISSDLLVSKKRIQGIVFVDDDYPTWLKNHTISSFTQEFNFDPSKYIINLGDTNGDFKINASDASDILKLYSDISTTAGYEITAVHLKHFDINSDGSIDSKDASNVLAYYTFLSTGGKGSLKKFVGK